MPEPQLPAEPLARLGLVAAAIRETLGEDIDAYPGHRDPDAPSRSTAPTAPSP